jgi:hypothetical protein
MFYTFATQECVYNNLYRCIGMGRWWRNIQQWDGVKCGKTPDSRRSNWTFSCHIRRKYTHSKRTFFYCYFTPPQMHFLVKH